MEIYTVQNCRVGCGTNANKLFPRIMGRFTSKISRLKQPPTQSIFPGFFFFWVESQAYPTFWIPAEVAKNALELPNGKKQCQLLDETVLLIVYMNQTLLH